jgi:hypothetical protein
MEIQNGSMEVTLLDLEGRKVSFTQDVTGDLDWTRLGAAWREDDPNKIGAQALEGYEQYARFFVSEIRKRLERAEPNEPEPVVVLLSEPRAFPVGRNLRPFLVRDAAEPVC